MGEHFPEQRLPFPQGLDIPVVRYLLSHIPPGPFHRVEAGAVRGQEEKFKLAVPCKPVFDFVGMVVGDVVQHHDDFWCVPVFKQYFLKMPFECTAIAPFRKTGRYLPCVIIKAPEYRLPLPFALLAADLWLPPFCRPLVTHCCRVWQRKFIFIQ